MAKLRDVGQSSGALFDVKKVSDLAGYDPDSAIPPTEFPDFSKGVEAEFCCPKCSYEWRGVAKPTEADAAEVES